MARQSKAPDGAKAEPDRLLQTIGARVREARKQAGLTGQQLAEAIGTTKTWIYSVEEGRQNVTLQGLRRLLRALGLDLHEVVSTGPDLPQETARLRRLHQTSSALILLLGPVLDELRELKTLTGAALGHDESGAGRSDP